MISLTFLEFSRPKCHLVLHNLQGGKDGKCQFYHEVDSSYRREKGNIVQMKCGVKFYFFWPTFDETTEVPSTNHIAIISYGEHTHPPPPPRKIPSNVKDKLIQIIREFGATEITARKLVASPLLPILLNGKTSLSAEHISLTNLSVVNHIIRGERKIQHPHGTSFAGVQHLMTSQELSDPYIRQCIQFPDGKFVVLCQFKEQSALLFRSYELQIDKTFSRTITREFVVNSYSHATRRSTTIARVFFDSEDDESYFHAMSLIFHTAEKDMNKKIPWGHLVPENGQPNQFRLKAIIVDENGGQCKGLGRYFATEYPAYGDADWHVSKIVKTCAVHFKRSVFRLKRAGVNEGIYLN